MPLRIMQVPYNKEVLNNHLNFKNQETSSNKEMFNNKEATEDVSNRDSTSEVTSKKYATVNTWEVERK